MRGTLAAAALLAFAAPVAAQAPCGLEDLGWIAGHWSGEEEGGKVSEEVWLPPAGGLLIGVHRDVRPGRGAFFELLRIEARPDGGIAYVAQPMGGAATRFELVACGEAGGAAGGAAANARAVFENPAHDYPQRIVYAREGDTLVARIEGDVDGETKSSEWRWGLRK